MIVHSSGELIASESAATQRIMDAQSEDEATKIFQSSLIKKAQVISRPSADDESSSNSDGISTILRSTGNIENPEEKLNKDFGNKTVRK